MSAPTLLVRPDFGRHLIHQLGQDDLRQPWKQRQPRAPDGRAKRIRADAGARTRSAPPRALLVYLFVRRALVKGLMGVGGK
ncbi:hypothetical protein ACFV47_05690 [Streptomyces solisilvae]|uniref:hypothetical protein n=1 Tax=Streptomyces malaysiensis TaxID=92644 RepID=UPI003678463A